MSDVGDRIHIFIDDLEIARGSSYTTVGINANAYLKREFKVAEERRKSHPNGDALERLITK